jgi:hypothetical protein
VTGTIRVTYRSSSILSGLVTRWQTYNSGNALAGNIVYGIALVATGTNSYTLHVATNGGLSVHYQINSTLRSNHYQVEAAPAL